MNRCSEEKESHFSHLIYTIILSMAIVKRIIFFSFYSSSMRRHIVTSKTTDGFDIDREIYNPHIQQVISQASGTCTKVKCYARPFLLRHYQSLANIFGLLIPKSTELLK